MAVGAGFAIKKVVVGLGLGGGGEKKANKKEGKEEFFDQIHFLNLRMRSIKIPEETREPVTIWRANGWLAKGRGRFMP